MAELIKTLHIYKNADGSTSTAKLYTTTTESGSTKVGVEVDGITAYAAVGGASPTPLKVQDAAGATYTVYNSAKPAYGYTLYNTAGTYTFSVPQGVTNVRVTVIGAGGGGAGSNEEYYDGWWFWKGDSTGGTGGDSSAFGLTATGGGGGSCTKAEIVHADVVITGGAGGSPSGNNGATKRGTDSNDDYWATAAGGAGFTVLGTEYGVGGSVRVYDLNNMPYLAAGGSGGYQHTDVAVTAGAVYSIVVGASGAAGDNIYDRGQSVVSAGGSGCVLVEFGGDI